MEKSIELIHDNRPIKELWAMSKIIIAMKIELVKSIIDLKSLIHQILIDSTYYESNILYIKRKVKSEDK